MTQTPTTEQHTAASRLSLLLDRLAYLRQEFETAIGDGRLAQASARGASYIDTTQRLIEMLNPRDIGGETSGIAVTITGLDIYVHDQGERLAVSVNADDAPKPAVVESFDGTSWEQPIF